jgi:proton glutamate symport protein
MTALLILIALATGLALGIIGSLSGWGEAAASIADPVGGMWLDGLRMTIVPLVVSLLILGVSKATEAARAGTVAAQTIATFMALLATSSIMAAIILPSLLAAWPLPAGLAESLKGALSTSQPVGDPPGYAAFLRSFIPSNPLAAAANDAILPLTIFTLIFAFAMQRLRQDQRGLLIRLSEAVSETMLIVIGWVLKLAPIGVFALAVVVGARAGFAALGALAHYVLMLSSLGIIIWICAWLLAWWGGGISPARYARVMLPVHAVAISTQSSLASLPAMLKAVQELGVRQTTADMVLPMAVALFRATGPAMNLGVALYVAHWYGIEPSMLQIIAAVAIAATTTLGAVSLPGQLSFVTSIAPIALALGVPIEPLGLLIAVETIPDIFRTLGNAAMDVSVTKTLSRRFDKDPT